MTAFDALLLVLTGATIYHVARHGLPVIRLPQRKQEAVNRARPLPVPLAPGPPPPPDEQYLGAHSPRRRPELPEETEWDPQDGKAADSFAEMMAEFERTGWIGPKHDWLKE